MSDEKPKRLVFRRRKDEAVEITLGGETVIVEVANIYQNKVKLCFYAPTSVKVMRYEVAGLERKGLCLGCGEKLGSTKNCIECDIMRQEAAHGQL